MSTYIGEVAHVSARDWKNDLKLYHFQLRGSPIIHNCGSVDPGVSEGDTITFEEYNRKVKVESIRPVSSEEVSQAEPTEAPAQSSSAVSVDVGERIRRQSARRDAIALVTMAMETNLLPYPKSGKAEDKWDRMLDLVDETTKDLLEQEEEKWTKRSS